MTLADVHAQHRFLRPSSLWGKVEVEAIGKGNLAGGQGAGWNLAGGKGSEDLAGGKLHAAANDATRKSHWGRIKHRDGTFEDIAPHNGGSVRTVLDNVDPTSSDDEYQSLDEEEPNQTYLPELDSSSNSSSNS